LRRLVAFQASDSLQLRRELKAADALEEQWVLVIEHEDGLEVQGAGGLALEIDRAETVRPSGWLLREDPVWCWVAAGAGLALVGRCPRCGRNGPPRKGQPG
jgi:hypothetical protein